MRPFSINQKWLIVLSIIGTGITSVTTQLVTIREFLTQFHGNEITISLVLFCWLFLTGIGSLAAKGVKQTSLKFYALLILMIAVWPLLQLIAIRSLQDMFIWVMCRGMKGLIPTAITAAGC